ncbi:MAG: tetratricopeptide repeat protein [Nitrospirae bacterium]|nr:tetratricopeptide repeat protein [Nitrospirota bacterium]
MPKVIKKRTVKKAESGSEDVSSIASETLQYVKEKKNVLISVIAVLCIAVAAVAGFRLYASSLTAKSHALEREASDYYYGRNLKNPLSEEERFKKALELYQQASKVKSSALIQFYIGNSYHKLNDYANAIKAYTEFIDKYSKEEKIMPIVYQKLISSYMKAGKTEDALRTIEAFKKFNNSIFKDFALIEEARIYESLGKTDDARKKYEEILKEFPNSLWSIEAKLKTSAKTEREIKTP